ncbi:MAG: heavy metal translocating P-type ATPase [Hyphomicrobiaceae bacterium]
MAEALIRPAANAAALARQGQAGASAETTRSVTLAVENMRCGGCMSTIERALREADGVRMARANLTAKRVTVVLDPTATDVPRLIDVLDRRGFKAAELTRENSEDDRAYERDLLRRVGVAGFAAANVMLLSVSVWAGYASDMDATVGSLFHWISALIALPAIAYAGQPFFRSGWRALRGGHLNMDVPISLGIILATGMSLFQTIRGTEQVYFDAAITLAFFLLIGRFLDERMRTRARGAAQNLLGLKSMVATVIGEDGRLSRVPSHALMAGMRVQIAAGERVPVDGLVRRGRGEIEESLITGETVPRLVEEGARVYAGTVSTVGTLEVEATATDEGTLVAEIGRLMSAAEQGRGRYVRLADRAARIYAPAVHILGLATLVGWLLLGVGWETALTYAIAVLIITCPCALALAVPAVQVAAASRLFARGVVIKAGDGLERLAEADAVVLDKTGTLTRGEPRLANADEIGDAALAAAARLAAHSRHPYSRAIVRAAERRGLSVAAVDGITEVAGCGLLLETPQGQERLGRADWVGIAAVGSADGATLWHRRGKSEPVGFRMEDALRPDAPEIVRALGRASYAVELLSGDRAAAVDDAARAAGIGTWRGQVGPEGKIARLQELRAAGRRVVMIGDGLNDAPALASAHASISPSSAADISQTAADVVFQGEHLGPVVETLAVAKAARAMALQNFAIAIAYNIVCVPLAMAGLVTPLIAALAMSGSSIAVTANALRLRTRKLELRR